MSEIHFTKMHGIGNDYIYINCMESCPDDLPSLAREMSDRHRGVGSDGIILILPSDKADFRMRIFNADGSEAAMCGNGSRCVAKYIHDHDLSQKQHLHLETLAGIKVLSLNIIGGEVESVTVDMGVPEILDPDARPATSAGEVALTAVSMGNPHGVVFTDSLAGVDFDRLGPELERHPMWPDRANIEFVEAVSPSHLKMRVWERGSGETLACGTGACAAAVAAASKGLTGRDVTVSLRGGDLHIVLADNGHVMMTGPATTVFEGVYTRQNT